MMTPQRSPFLYACRERSLGSCHPLATLAMQGQESTLSGLVELMMSRGVSPCDWLRLEVLSRLRAIMN